MRNQDASGTRVLIYSYDVFGLGHLRRSLKIAEHLAETLREVSVLIVTGNNELHTVRTDGPIDFVKLPCFHREGKDAYVPKFLGTSVRDLSRIRSQLLHATFKSFQPDLVLVDHAPTGVRGELVKSIRWLKRARPEARLVLCLRDILDDPKIVRKAWQRGRLHDVIENYYDSIWIFGSPDVYDVVAEYGFSVSLARKVNYCGYLMPSTQVRRTREAVRDELRVGSGRFVLVTGGGGGDAYKLMRTYLKSLKGLRREFQNGSELHSLLILGPEMPLHDRRRLQARAKAMRGATRLLDFSAELHNYMNAADLVISMGGYNSLCEILTLQKRAIIVPRVQPVREQWIRAERLQTLGLVDVLHPADLSPATLTAKILDALHPNGVALAAAADVLDMQGLRSVARFASDEVRPATAV